MDNIHGSWVLKKFCRAALEANWKCEYNRVKASIWTINMGSALAGWSLIGTVISVHLGICDVKISITESLATNEEVETAILVLTT